MISCMKLLKDTTFDKCTTLKLFGILFKLIQVCQKTLNDKTTKNVCTIRSFRQGDVE